MVTKNYAVNAQSSANGGGAGSSSSNSFAGSSALASLPKETVTHYREKVIHFLAMGPYLLQELVKKVGTVEANQNTISAIKEIIHEVSLH